MCEVIAQTRRRPVRPTPLSRMPADDICPSRARCRAPGTGPPPERDHPRSGTARGTAPRDRTSTTDDPTHGAPEVPMTHGTENDRRVLDG
ncbi:hypothetical protein KNE206_32440 [Kitasatospora sp. NE20-6]